VRHLEGFGRLAKLADAVEKWLEEGRIVDGRSADRLFAGASVFSWRGCGRWVVYRLSSGGAFYTWAARWLLSCGAPAVDVLCAVVAVAVGEVA